MNIVSLKVFLIKFIEVLSNLITYAIFARIILSWFKMGGSPGMQSRGRLEQFLIDVTDPFLNLAKKLPHKVGMIDLSPLIVLFGISILSNFLIKFIAGM
jgi:uncharacterized protein YggT (Ycf19 family)